MPDDGDMDSPVEKEFQQAAQALEDAAKARDAGLSDAAVINRLYYAAFHSVQAALYDRGFEPTSHGGVLSLLGSEIIAVDDASRRDGRFLVNSRNFDSRPTTATTSSMKTSMRSTHGHGILSPICKPSVSPLSDATARFTAVDPVSDAN